MSLTITGLSKGQLEDNAMVGVYEIVDGGTPLDNTTPLYEQYIAQLDAGKWITAAPGKVGKYEVRVFTKLDIPDGHSKKEVLYGVQPFSVGTSTASKDDAKLSKDFYLVNENVSVTIKGITTQQMDSNAFAALYYDKDEVTAADPINQVLIGQLEGNKTNWNFEAPAEYGKYKVVIFTQQVDKGELSKVQYNKTPLAFTVGSKPAKDGDVVLAKTEFLVGDLAYVTIKGLTKEQVNDGAWGGVYTC